MKSPKTIKFKTSLITMILLILVPVLFIQVYGYYGSFQRRYNAELQTNLEVARAVRKVFEGFVVDILRQETAIGYTLSFADSLSAEDINLLLVKSRDEYKSIRHFSWIDPQGIIIGSTYPGAIGENVSKRTYFSEIINGRDWYISNLAPELFSNDLVFIIAKSVQNKSGDLLGVVIAVVDDARLDEEFALYRPKGGAISLIDSNGMLVYRFPRIDANWEQRNWLKMMPGLQQVLNGNVRMGVGYAPFKGENRIFANVPLSFGWVAAAGRSEKEAIAPVYDIIAKETFFFILVLGAGFILPLLLSRRILKSVSKLENYAGSVAHGKYNFDPHRFIISEFQVLAATLKKMANQVQTREKALKKERNILDGIMSSTDVSLVYLDRDFNFMAANLAYANHCHKKQDELIGKNHFELFPHAENEKIFKYVRDTGDTVFYKDKPFEFPDQPERGVTFWDWSLAPIKSNGEVIGLAFALRETTKHKYDQDVLRLQARVLESMAEGVSVGNEQAIILFTNPAEDAMFGYEPGELIGKHVSIQSDNPSEENNRILMEIKEALLSTGFYKGEFRHRKKDGSVFYSYANISRLDVDGLPYFVCVQRDITEERTIKKALQESQKQLECANEQLEQKVLQRTTELAAANLQLKSANEELDWRATKLRALASELTLVEQRVRKDVAKVLHDHLQQILAAVKFQVQNLSGLDYNQLEKTSADLNEALSEAIRVSRSVTAQLSPPILFDAGLPAGLGWLARWMNEKHNFSVHLEVDEQLPDFADDIKIFLFESARELLFNAVKHASVFKATVTLRQIDENHINLVVTDKGSGFDTKELNSNADTINGFGLFSIMERIPLFGGTIEIDSSPGDGSRFSLAIPYSVATRQLSGSGLKMIKSNDSAAPCAASKISILIVDDHTFLRQGLIRVLCQEPDFIISGEAGNGVEAVELAKKLQPDIILMDITMPEMDGIEATRIIHQAFPKIKILGLSMYIKEEYSQKIRAAGAVGYVSKSDSREQLLTSIRSSMQDLKLCSGR